MMRSLYSGVSGLKTHQVKMDVIGNNIANVNTTAYKSQSITFSELMYQTTQAASGPNATSGTAVQKKNNKSFFIIKSICLQRYLYYLTIPINKCQFLFDYCHIEVWWQKSIFF